MTKLWVILRACAAAIDRVLSWLKGILINSTEQQGISRVAEEKAYLSGQLRDVQARLDKNSEILLRPLANEEQYATLKQRQYRLEREANSLCKRLLALTTDPAGAADPMSEPGSMPAGGNDDGITIKKPTGTAPGGQGSGGGT